MPGFGWNLVLVQAWLQWYSNSSLFTRRYFHSFSNMSSRRQSCCQSDGTHRRSPNECFAFQTETFIDSLTSCLPNFSGLFPVLAVVHWITLSMWNLNAPSFSRVVKTSAWLCTFYLNPVNFPVTWLAAGCQCPFQSPLIHPDPRSFPRRPPLYRQTDVIFFALRKRPRTAGRRLLVSIFGPTETI